MLKLNEEYDLYPINEIRELYLYKAKYQELLKELEFHKKENNSLTNKLKAQKINYSLLIDKNSSTNL